MRTNGALAWLMDIQPGAFPAAPEALKDAWKIFRERWSPAIDLELRLDWQQWDPLWMVNEFLRPEVGARSVYAAQTNAGLRTRDGTGRCGWACLAMPPRCEAR